MQSFLLMDEPAIKVAGLAKRFGSVQALRGIDFEVPRGTIFGLLGPNGAGKTTAVRILATIIKPDEGTARVYGHDVLKDPASVRYSIGLAGQSAAIDPNLTGRENLRLIGLLAQMARRTIKPRADNLLERFALGDASDRPVKTYSGGMRRRLDVAAALVAKPPVLFLDEPTTGLDIQSRTELWKVIKDLVSEGRTVLLTTQYLEEADQLADRIAVVDGGMVIANDTVAALKARLGTTIIEIELPDAATASQAQGLLASLVEEHPECEDATVRLISSRAPRLLIEALRALDAAAITPETISVREPSLDDVFLVLTGHHVRQDDRLDHAEEVPI